MTLLRSLAILSASLLILTSCGGKKEKAEEQPATAVTENTTDDLFDEFYDSSNADAEADATEAAAVEDELIEDEVVETEVMDDEPVMAEPSFSVDGRYVVQVSCVASEAIAEDVARKLENSGYPVYVAEVLNPTPQLLGTYFRIRIGGFDNLTDAKNFGEGVLLPTGFDYWPDNRSNDNVGIGDFGLGDDASFEVETVVEAPVEEPYVAPTPEPEPTVVETVTEVVTETVTETAPAVVEEVTETVSNVTEAADEWGTSEW